MDRKTAQVKVSSEGRVARLVLPADFRISGAKAFMATVARAMRKKPEALVFDAAPLERVDAAALQAAVVAWRALKNAGIAGRWENCPSVLIGGARLLGLASAAGIEA